MGVICSKGNGSWMPRIHSTSPQAALSLTLSLIAKSMDALIKSTSSSRGNLTPVAYPGTPLSLSPRECI